MINLDEDENIQAINDVLGRESRRGLRKLIKIELTKTDKLENRILCLCDYRFFLMTISKNNKPSKVDSVFHFFDLKKIDTLSSSQLTIQTTDNKEYKLHSFESSSISDSNDYENGNDSLITNVDEILYHYCSNLFDVYPSVTLKDVIEIVNIQPEKRFARIYKDINEAKLLRKKLNLCDSFSKAYTVCCDYSSVCFYQEVVWDANVIYGKNSLTEFSLNDFDYVNLKDFSPLIWALRHNKWFESFHSEGLKLTNEMQEELIKVLILPTCNFKKLSLIQSNLKPDFFNKLQNYLSQVKSKQPSQVLQISNTVTNLKSINFSRNSIEDRGLIQFISLFKDQQTSSSHSNLIDIGLSKCSISSKSINNMFSTINLYLLNTLDLSHNNLKDEPIDFFKYLSEHNQLIELNLSNTDLDVDKLFSSLSRGGCETGLKKLILNNNHTFAKFSNNENIIKFLLNSKALNHFEVSNCKISANLVQTILSSLKHNQYLSNGVYLNLSSNDLGSTIRHFMHEFHQNYSINSLDLSDNNLDADSDILISQMYHSNIKSLALNRNFQYSKNKVAIRVIQSLIKWLTSKSQSLEQLWLIDCRLKTCLNDLISEMGEFSRLKLLDISGNDLGDFGTNLLSKSLQVNRSLETLIFDRSNISLASYQRIIDSLKRNFTLKTIQMPINDICILYQKSPDKVVDIVKQMTDTLSQRSLLNAHQKCDLNQLFKTKMKLINESNNHLLNMSQNTLNSSHVSSNSSPSPSRINKSIENETDSDSLNENSNEFNLGHSVPSSIKEILQNLNESANGYLTQNSIEKQFKKLNDDLVDKLDNIVIDLERELVTKVKKTYPKYSSSIQCQLNSNQSNSNPKQNPIESDLTKLKSYIRDYANSMLVQIHNDICEMTYNLSVSMAEKIMLETQQSKPQIPEIKKNHSDSRPNPLQTEHQSTIELLGRKLVGGIKLPFANIPTSPMPDTPSNNSNSIQQRIDLINNSKSKRPISSQIYETPNIQSNDLVNRSLSPSKHLSSSSNENLIENSSDDDLLGDKSRDKTPDSLNETPKFNNKIQSSIPSNKKENVFSEPSVPIPAPRKTKSIVKSFLGNLGVGPSTKPTSPKIGRKFISDETNKETEAPQETKIEEIIEPEDSIRPLQHINKSRPKRANIKRPTVKNPSANIETDLPVEEILTSEKLKSIDSIEFESLNSDVNQEQIKPLSPPPSSSSSQSNNPRLLSNQVEQPKISLNVLENVKLRKIVRTKPEEQNTQPQEPISSHSSKLVSRFSMFESKQEGKNEYKPLKKSDEISEIIEEIEAKPSKPLPPVPPNKPPRPTAFNPSKSSAETTPTNNFVKLRPVSTFNVAGSQTNNTNTKTNDLINGIKLLNLNNNNNNSTGTTSTSSISSSSTSSVTDARLNTVKELNLENDKRSSVKNIVQMWSDESKA